MPPKGCTTVPQSQKLGLPAANNAKKRQADEALIRADERCKVLKELEHKGVLANPKGEDAHVPDLPNVELTQAQKMRRLELLAQLDVVKAGRLENKNERKSIAEEEKMHQEAKDQLEKRKLAVKKARVRLSQETRDIGAKLCSLESF